MHIVVEHNGLALQFAGGRVEGLGEQRIVAYIEQIAGSVNGAEKRMQQLLVLFSVERSPEQRGISSGGSRVVGGEINEVLPVGHELRPAMRSVMAAQFGQSHGSSTGGGYAGQRLGGKRLERDRAVFTPGSSARADLVANDHRRAAGNVNALELAVGEEADRAVVWRPEWPDPSLRAG